MGFLQSWHGLHAPEGRQVDGDQQQQQDDHSDSQRRSKRPVAGFQKLVTSSATNTSAMAVCGGKSLSLLDLEFVEKGAQVYAKA